MCSFNPNGILKQRPKRDVSNGGYTELDTSSNNVYLVSAYLFLRKY